MKIVIEMENRMKYTVKLEKLSPQKTRTGKTKLDRNGDPLSSVRIKQTWEQRQQMLKQMVTLLELWKISPDYWDTKKHHTGNDPVAYTAEEMFEDFASRINNWKLQKNDLYKSFVDRHNFLLDQFIEYIGNNRPQDEWDLIELAEYKCRIVLKERNENAIRLRASLQASDIWDVQ